MSDQQALDYNLISNIPLFQRVFVFMIGLLMLGIAAAFLLLCFREVGVYGLIFSLPLSLLFGYVGIMYLHVVFTDRQTFNRKLGWLMAEYDGGGLEVLS